jgi:hypothetical protein
MAADKDKVKFHYIKSNDFRVVHVDGVFGGVTPTGDIFVSVFNQRPPIPNVTVQPVKENGELGEEILSERVSRDGIIRELEVGLAMRPDVAEAMIRWLQDRLGNIAEMKEKSEKTKI